MSSVESEGKTVREAHAQTVRPLVMIFKDPLRELGLPAWLPKALTYVLIIGTAVSLGYITAGYQEFAGFGYKAVVSDSALNFLAWLPIYGFVAAAVLCTLRRANETLLNMAAGLLIFGVFRSSDLQGMPASRYWFWGVVLALALTLVRPAGKIFIATAAAAGATVIAPFAALGIAVAERGKSLRDKIPYRRKAGSEMRA